MPGQMTLADGARLRVRPIVPADREPLADAFDAPERPARAASASSAPKPRLSARELDYLTDVDHVTHEALVAIDETTGDIVGVGRYATGSGGGAVADMALAVADAWQRRGIGHAPRRAPHRARPRERHHALTGTALADNRRVRSLLDRLGFRVRSVSAGVVEVELDVPPARRRAAPRYRGAPRTSGSSSRELRASLANTRVR